MDIKKLMGDVQEDFGMGGLTEGVLSDFAREVAMRAVEVEREACAKVCEQRADTYLNPPIDGNEFIAGYREEEARLCADAIRMRSNAEFSGRPKAGPLE